MSDLFTQFERVVRTASQFTEARSEPAGGFHAFDERNIHPRLPDAVKRLFDDGHYAQATFEAYKFLDKEVQRFSGCPDNGVKLMMKALSGDSPLIRLTSLSSLTEKDEQEGFRFLFAGSVMAIRNPRGHDYGVIDTPDMCLDHLALASLLLRRLEEAGYK
jgi:uncharacterized protein (TIGR02391 family)